MPSHLSIRACPIFLAVVALAGCGGESVTRFTPIPDVSVLVTVGEFSEPINGLRALHIDYRVDNGAEHAICRSTELAQLQVNGEKSSFVHYNSLASDIEVNFELSNGRSEHALLFYLPFEGAAPTIESLNFVHHGLTPCLEPNDT